MPTDKLSRRVWQLFKKSIPPLDFIMYIIGVTVGPGVIFHAQEAEIAPLLSVGLGLVGMLMFALSIFGFWYMDPPERGDSA